MTTAPPIVDRYGARTAPDALQLVQSLANTISVGSEPDLLDDLPAARAWANQLWPVLDRRQGKGWGEETLNVGDLATLRELRTAVRAALGTSGPRSTALSGDSDATRFDIATVLRTTERGVTVLPEGNAGQRLAGAVVIALWESQLTGKARQLKLCRNPRCQIAFYDASRNQSGTWHYGARCGNASRVHTYRALKASS